MGLTRAEVEHIADLARLRLTEEEIARFQEQLSSILDHFARLQELDTSGIPPTSSVLPMATPLRKDEPRPSLMIDDVLANAQQVMNDQFRVPPVLDNE